MPSHREHPAYVARKKGEPVSHEMIEDFRRQFEKRLISVNWQSWLSSARFDSELIRGCVARLFATLLFGLRPHSCPTGTPDTLDCR